MDLNPFILKYQAREGQSGIARKVANVKEAREMACHVCTVELPPRTMSDDPTVVAWQKKATTE